MSAVERRIESGGSDYWVFARGSLGDTILLWPVLRAWVRMGIRVHFVADGSRARLAEREVGVRAHDAEQRKFNDLWMPGGSAETVGGAFMVVGYFADPADALAALWKVNAGRMFEVMAAAKAAASIPEAARRADAAGAAPKLRANAGGPVVLHAGSGGRVKRWAIERWAGLAAALHATGARVEVIAGEVEAEQFDGHAKEEFGRAGGRFVETLEELADTVRATRVFVGADSGPTHLAAQLGVRTVALFGPTEPRVWAPIGPAVEVVAPESPRGMEWLGVERVVQAIGAGG